MRVLVTGGAGFIGSAVVRQLIADTDFDVLNVDCLTYAGNLASLGAASRSPRYAFARVDICDRQRLDAAFAEFRPTAVIHLAAESHVDRSIDAPEAFVRANVLGTYNLLQAARRQYERTNRHSAFRFLHVSTDEVFGDLGPGDGSFDEQTPYAPSSPYSATKAASDHLVRAWGRTYGLPVVMTNCSNNYGPCQFPEKLIPHMILNALEGKPLPVYGDGDQIRDWLFVEDHARALQTVLMNGQPGDSYAIGGRNEQRNIDVVRAICRVLEKIRPKTSYAGPLEELITFVEDRPGHDTRYAIDAGKIQRELGWTPLETFESGLQKTVEWYVENEPWWRAVLDGSYRLERIGVGIKGAAG